MVVHPGVQCAGLDQLFNFNKKQGILCLVLENRKRIGNVRGVGMQYNVLQSVLHNLLWVWFVEDGCCPFKIMFDEDLYVVFDEDLYVLFM